MRAAFPFFGRATSGSEVACATSRVPGLLAQPPAVRFQNFALSSKPQVRGALMLAYGVPRISRVTLPTPVT